MQIPSLYRVVGCYKLCLLVERERVTVTSEFISLNGDEDEPNRDISAAAGLCFPPHYPHRVSPQHKNQEFSPFLQRDNLLLIFITMPSYKYIWVIVG